MRLLFVLALLLLSSCFGGARYFLEGEELERFENGGPPAPMNLAEDRLAAGMVNFGPYQVGPGDVLSVQAPRAAYGIDGDEATGDPENGVHLARIGAEGKIQIPLIREVEVAGKNLMEVEAEIASKFQKTLFKHRPSVVVKVDDYQMTRVNVIGAVETPGIVELKRNEMTLYGALSAAGGILKANNLVVGAQGIYVRRPGEEREKRVMLPVMGLNIPDENVVLVGGETIEVLRYEPETFTVVGLVMKPGAYAYPPEKEYNLMTALAEAGGVDRIAAPPYATVFRKALDGGIVGRTVAISGDELVQSSGMSVKAGDVIVVEHTAMSWSRSLLAQVLRLQVNFFVDPIK